MDGEMIELTVNGRRDRFSGDATMPLLWYLREQLGLLGTRYGCGVGLCGCCTVHVNGNAVRSCTVTMERLHRAAIVTIEGLKGNAGDAGGLHPVQTAWMELAVPQCGYCQSGQIMQAAALLAKNSHPDAATIDQAMAGNLCRCGTYPRIRSAIQRAASLTTTPQPAGRPVRTKLRTAEREK